jgi:putative membrane protein
MYLWIKAAHLIMIVAWFAGLFYIFRLFVYHVKYKDKAGLPEVFEEMERKLMRYIMLPASLLTVATGATLIVLNPDWLSQGWLHTKLSLLVFLFGYHGYASKVRKRFAKKDYFLSEKACRVINEVPTVILVLVVLLVVLKPF